MERCPDSSADIQMVTNEIRQFCSAEYRHYKYKQDLAKKGFDEKTEASFKFICDVWGYQTFFFGVLLIGLIFHKQAYDFLIMRFKPLGRPVEKK